jgi:SAM-dependent methyltransferase
MRVSSRAGAPVSTCFAEMSGLKRCRCKRFHATIYPVRPKHYIALLTLAALLIVSLHAQAPRYEFREQHSPDGIGKFYMGREISHVMGHQAADWLERPERNAEEKTELLVQSLPVKSGDSVADIGAGTGYFTRQLAAKVGPTGKVFAVDIQPEMITLLTNRMAALSISNVQAILGTIADPKLPPASVDWVLMVDVYHEFSHPYEMMQAICKSLKPQGKVIFVEFRSEDPEVPIKPLHKMTEAQVRKEMSVHPLVWRETIKVLPRQHIIIFEKTP